MARANDQVFWCFRWTASRLEVDNTAFPLPAKPSAGPLLSLSVSADSFSRSFIHCCYMCMLHYLVLSFQFHNIFLFLVNPAFLVFLPVSLALLRTKQARYSAAALRLQGAWNQSLMQHNYFL